MSPIYQCERKFNDRQMVQRIKWVQCALSSNLRDWERMGALNLQISGGFCGRFYDVY